MRTRHLLPSRQRGQSLVEMALTMMILVWLLAGAVDFGMGYFSFVAIRDAAQEGALYGSIDPTGNIEARVRASSSKAPVDLNDLINVRVTVLLPGTVCAGNHLTVSVAYDYPITVPLVGILTGPTITLTSSSTSTILLPSCTP
jgi:Flp pilus assembly protein TadG